MGQRRYPNYSLKKRFEDSDITLTQREKLALENDDPVSLLPKDETNSQIIRMLYKHATQKPLISLPHVCCVHEKYERVYDTEKLEDIKRYWRDAVAWHKRNEYNLNITLLVEKALDLEG